MIRFFDLFFSVTALCALGPFLFLVAAINVFAFGSIFFTQQRAGLNGRPFTIIKFRSLPLSTPKVLTHELDPSSITPWGRFLRDSKIDELPQLLNILFGEMSFVGPRPTLLSHKRLLSLREKYGICEMTPGLTGLAQVNKIDMSNPTELVAVEKVMREKFGAKLYLVMILKTLALVFFRSKKLERK